MFLFTPFLMGFIAFLHTLSGMISYFTTCLCFSSECCIPRCCPVAVSQAVSPPAGFQGDCARSRAASHRLDILHRISQNYAICSK